MQYTHINRTGSLFHIDLKENIYIIKCFFKQICEQKLNEGNQFQFQSSIDVACRTRNVTIQSHKRKKV